MVGTGLINISHSQLWDLQCWGMVIPGTPVWGGTRSFVGILAAPFIPL